MATCPRGACLRGCAARGLSAADQVLALNRLSRKLPIRAAIIPPPPTAEPEPTGPESDTSVDGWEGAAQRGLAALRSLVTVHRTDPGTPPTLTAPYRSYLRQHVRLALDSARIAALSRDAVLYRTSLTAAHDLLIEFFAEGTARDEAAVALVRLAETPLEVPPPPIGRTLSLLESLPHQGPTP